MAKRTVKLVMSSRRVAASSTHILLSLAHAEGDGESLSRSNMTVTISTICSGFRLTEAMAYSTLSVSHVR